MLIEDDRKKIKERFEKLRGDVTILNFTQKLECRFCQPTEEILEELSALSDRIKLEIHNFIEDKTLAEKFKVDKIPATIILGVKDYGVRFYGIPSGYEFSSLIDAIIDVGNGKTDLREETKKKLSELKTPTHIQVFVTPTCPYCQTAVRIMSTAIVLKRLATLAMLQSDIPSPLVQVTEMSGFWYWDIILVSPEKRHGCQPL